MGRRPHGSLRFLESPNQKSAVLPVSKGSGETKRLFLGNGRLGAEFALMSSLAESAST